MKYSKLRSILHWGLPVLLIVFCACEPQRNNDESNDGGANKDSKELAEEKNEDKFSDKDNKENAEFVVEAVASSMHEIKLAGLAEERAKSKEVKEVAGLLKTQHTDLLNKLKSYAQAKVISIPTEETDKTDNKTENLADDKDFDKNWCEHMKDMHEKSIKKFEDASTSLSDAELKNLASNALPTLRKHYDRLTACHDNLKK